MSTAHNAADTEFSGRRSGGFRDMKEAPFTAGDFPALTGRARRGTIRPAMAASGI